MLLIPSNALILHHHVCHREATLLWLNHLCINNMKH